jgi:hypothetical protein
MSDMSFRPPPGEAPHENRPAEDLPTYTEADAPGPQPLTPQMEREIQEIGPNPGVPPSQQHAFDVSRALYLERKRREAEEGLRPPPLEDVPEEP